MTTLSINLNTSSFLLTRFLMFCQTLQTCVSRTEETDETVFIQIYDRYSRIVDKVCFTFASDNDDYNDLRQDAWLNIWRGIDSFRGESKQSTWIYRVAINSCVSTARGSKKHTGNVRIDAADLYMADTADTDSIERLHYLLSCLNPIERSIMLLRLEDLDYEEIAKIMGMPRNTIATRLRRTRIKLAELSKRNDI